MRPSHSVFHSLVLSIAAVACLVARGATETTYSPSSTQVTTASTSGSGDNASVLILPFTAPAGENLKWVGPSVQQVLAADLTHGARTRVIAPANAAPAADADAALKAARDVGATMVVFGQAQSVGSEIRLTGEVLDVSSSRTLGAMKATGPADQLFHLEDAVAAQALAALPDSMRVAEEANAAPTTPTQPSAGYDVGAAYPASTTYLNTPATYYPPYPGYSYSYGYPFYPYPYYYPFGAGFIFIDHGHDHFHDHGHVHFDHGHFDHGHFDHGHFDGSHDGFHHDGGFQNDMHGRGFVGRGPDMAGGFTRMPMSSPAGSSFGGFRGSPAFTGGRGFTAGRMPSMGGMGFAPRGMPVSPGAGGFAGGAMRGGGGFAGGGMRGGGGVGGHR